MQRAVSLVNRASGVPPSLLIEAFDGLGEAYARAGRYGEALTVLERSLRVSESQRPPDAVGLARTLEGIAYAQQRKGDYPQAGVAIRRAIDLRRGASASHPNSSTS